MNLHAIEPTWGAQNLIPHSLGQGDRRRRGHRRRGGRRVARVRHVLVDLADDGLLVAGVSLVYDGRFPYGDRRPRPRRLAPEVLLRLEDARVHLQISIINSGAQARDWSSYVARPCDERANGTTNHAAAVTCSASGARGAAAALPISAASNKSGNDARFAILRLQLVEEANLGLCGACGRRLCLPLLERGSAVHPSSCALESTAQDRVLR